MQRYMDNLKIFTRQNTYNYMEFAQVFREIHYYLTHLNNFGIEDLSNKAQDILKDWQEYQISAGRQGL